MGEFVSLISAVKRDKEQFYLLLDKLNPLINKYVRLLYKDDKEDVRSELSLALWEAVNTIKYYENEGQVIKFLCTALKNRYLELYRYSRKIHDKNFIPKDDKEIPYEKACENYDIESIVFREDIENIISAYHGKKRMAAYLIIFENLSDIEIAGDLQISRQYVNRMRRSIYKEMKEKYYNI